MNVPCLIYVPSRLLISNHPQYFSEHLASPRLSTIGFEPFVFVLCTTKNTTTSFSSCYGRLKLSRL